jgi:hypothetical protein
VRIARWRRSSDVIARIVTVAVALVATVFSLAAQAPLAFKVASWNIRSGMGLKALTGGIGPMFSHTTQNCTDPSQPMNAWGWGLPQRALVASVGSDPSVIALGLQEAWGCGRPENVRSVLGWNHASGQHNGTALLARHGISGPLLVQQIATSGIDGTENQFLLGADVCVDAACAATARIYTVHFAGIDEAQSRSRRRTPLRSSRQRQRRRAASSSAISTITNATSSSNRAARRSRNRPASGSGPNTDSSTHGSG